MSAPVDTAFREMRNAVYREINGNIRVISAFRSVERQETVFNNFLAQHPLEEVLRFSAKPGHSEHHTGLAIDVVGPCGTLRGFIDTMEGQWVQENAYRFGFIVRYKEETEHITGYMDEPWHLRYIGAYAAARMRERGILTFEEFRIRYVINSADAHTRFESD